ncbi:DUF1566 domain-containing protein, partial [Vibrio parahaemolyticus]|uniref:Lcl domain-containing protein n=1 Tax=Vibrio parahaemolyticus TaxID=670 RepID=UPI00111E5CAD
SSYLVVVHNESDLSAIADGADVAKVAVRVTFNGEYVENELVSASKSQGSSADLVSDSVMTDSQGMAVFELTNLKAEALTLTMEYGGKQAEAEVKFNGDVETAVLDLKASVNNQSYSGTNEVMASLSDAFDNPLSGYEVSFSAPGNDNVDVQSQGSTNTYGEQAATVTWVGTTPSSDTTVDITAEWSQGGTPLSDITSVTFKSHDGSKLGICGGQVDDTDPENAKGQCLKVREIFDPNDNKLKRFTSTPSIAVMLGLGYHLDDSVANAGQSYAGIVKETGLYGPSGGGFARFRQDGDGTAGGTQHQRYCQNLADMGFTGRSDWRRPTKDELVSLYGESGNMWTEFGWPASAYYWSETPVGGYYYSVHPYNGNVGSNPPSNALYGSCVSTKQPEPTIGICGGQIDDKDPENAKGQCLKVREIIDPNDNKLKRFTSTPSKAVMDALGYHLDNSGTNAGQSYAGTSKETGSYGPSGGEFARFRQDGAGTAGGTQHQRYCQNLADMDFAGRSDWRRPTKDELVSLYGESGNMWTEFGWPAYFSYWSETPNGGLYYTVHLYNGGVNSFHPSYASYGSCVSNP